MNPGGWILLSVSVSAVIALTVFCYARLLGGRRVAPPVHPPEA